MLQSKLVPLGDMPDDRSDRLGRPQTTAREQARVEREGRYAWLLPEGPRDPLGLLDGDFGLSPREREIARLIAKGLPNKAIAAVLDISPWTVATHLKRMFAKLRVRSRSALIAELAIRGSKPPP